MVQIEQAKKIEINESKVMICLPTKGEMKTKTHDCLMRAYLRTIGEGIKTTIVYAEGTLVSAVRSALVKSFLDSNYTHLFFIDSDMTFEDDIILKLLNHNKDIVCGVAKVRGGKNFNVYHWVPHQEKYAPVTQINQPVLIEIDNTGCACVLIRRKVFEDIVNKKRELGKRFHEMWEKESDPFAKQLFFNLKKDECAFSAVGEKSEDMIFFEMARTFGYKMYCDLGIQLGHICDEVLR